MALRSVSFVDLDWAAEEEKLRVRVNQRKEKKKKKQDSNSNSKGRRNIKRIIMSTPEQLQVTAFLSDISATTTDDVALQAMCAMDAAKAFLTLLEPPPAYGKTTDRDKVDFYNDNFESWKGNIDVFSKALNWMSLAIHQGLYTSRSLSLSSSSVSSHGNDSDSATCQLLGLSISQENAVDPENATKFQLLLRAVGFENFVRIEKAVKEIMDSDDTGTPTSAPVIQDFLNTIEQEKNNVAEDDKEDFEKCLKDIVSWFRRHAENHQKRLEFLSEIFDEYHAAIADGGDVQSSAEGGTVQDSVAS